MEDSTGFGQTWYIGLDDSKSVTQVSSQALHAAQDANYDMLTVDITNSTFREKVEKLLKDYDKAVNLAWENSGQVPTPLVSPLTPEDTPLFPDESVSQYLAKTSVWLDLASDDPIVADVSRQVFQLEIAYAAFCGVQNLVIETPFAPGEAVTTYGLASFARVISESLKVGAYLQFSIVFPAGPEPRRDDQTSHRLRSTRNSRGNGSRSAASPEVWQSWETWNFIRSVCRYSNRLSVALRLPQQLPPNPVRSRWFSEPLRLLILSSSAFLGNRHGQPVLSKAHQAMLSKLMRLKQTPWLVLHDVGTMPNPTSMSDLSSQRGSTNIKQAPDVNSNSQFPALAESTASRPARTVSQDPTPHLSYLRWLQRNQPSRTIIEKFGAGYQDFLQAPLQPLADNLESITYEVFEKDPVKYDWYERAVMHALLDWSLEGKRTSSSTGAVVIAVVGAGRGPLVTRALRAAQLAQVNVEVWAVEKNPNAYVFLQRNNMTIWDRKVTVVKSDMRAWTGPIRQDGSQGHVDILVSELLGSFADNELSPECLDGVQHVLNPEHGISIPASYTAHLTPIASPRIHADILNKSVADDAAFEVPYVVMLHAFDYLALEKPQELTESWKNLSGEVDPDSLSRAMESNVEPIPDVQTCWQFSHPQPSSVLEQSALRARSGTSGGTGGATGGDGVNEHNTRFTSLTFRCTERGVCHGLAGYFETVLYASTANKSEPEVHPEDDDEEEVQAIELSINPVTIDAKSKDMISWFPIYFPLKVPVTFPDNSELVVNMWRMTDDRKVWYEWIVESFVVLGAERRMRIGTTEMHSSKKNGCLM